MVNFPDPSYPGPYLEVTPSLIWKFPLSSPGNFLLSSQILVQKRFFAKLILVTNFREITVIQVAKPDFIILYGDYNTLDYTVLYTVVTTVYIDSLYRQSRPTVYTNSLYRQSIPNFPRTLSLGWTPEKSKKRKGIHVKKKEPV